MDSAKTKEILSDLQAKDSPTSEFGRSFSNAETLAAVLKSAKATPKVQWELRTLMSNPKSVLTPTLLSPSTLTKPESRHLMNAMLSVVPTDVQQNALCEYVKGYKEISDNPLEVVKRFSQLPVNSQHQIMMKYDSRDAKWNSDQRAVFDRTINVDFKDETPSPFSAQEIEDFRLLLRQDPEEAELVAKIFQYAGTDELEALLRYSRETYGMQRRR